MAQKTHLPSELAAIVGVIDPDANTATTHTSAWVSMADFAMIMAVVMSGDLGSGASLDAKLEQATDDSGTDAKDLDGAAITQLTQAGGDSNKQAILQCYGEDLDLENEFSHVRLSMTIAGATSDSSAVVLGMSPRYAPASNHNASSVAEVVSL